MRLAEACSVGTRWVPSRCLAGALVLWNGDSQRGIGLRNWVTTTGETDGVGYFHLYPNTWSTIDDGQMA